jgi:isopentenyl diphosphate isomerase/L-lactate dehydrogenase-like FMN-dependent dehydrogenase
VALVNLAEYEAKAREILPLPVFDYYYGGAHDEITVRENCAAFQRSRSITTYCAERTAATRR